MSTAVANTPSHKVEQISRDRVVIRDLELFVGYDPKIDGPDDKRMRKYDATGIGKVVSRTKAMMERGQRPKLILGHNPDEDDGIERPVIGDFVAIEKRDINGVPGIVGDVEMTVEDFQTYLKSNRYPRRSAEIYSDGFMSEVALLGSRTPARPLRDTKFSKASLTHIDRFSREFAADTFADPTGTSHVGGPGNSFIPSTEKSKMASKPKSKNAIDDDDEDVDKMSEDELREAYRSAKKKLKAAEDEGKCGDDDKEKNELRKQRDTFARRLEDLGDRLAETQADLVRERYSRKLDNDRAAGFIVGDDKRRDAILDRIQKSDDPEAEYEFIKSLFARGPVDTRVDTRHLRLAGNDGADDTDIEERASKIAFDRAHAEGKPEKYAGYVREEMEKLRKTG